MAEILLLMEKFEVSEFRGTIIGTKNFGPEKTLRQAFAEEVDRKASSLAKTRRKAKMFLAQPEIKKSILSEQRKIRRYNNKKETGVTR